MKIWVLETVNIHVKNYKVTSSAEVIVMDPDEKNALLNQCADVEYIFRRIVKELKLPFVSNDGQKNEYQVGHSQAKINTTTGIAEIIFYVEAEEQDLIDSVKQRYDERKAYEISQMLKAAEIANRYDPDGLDETELGKLTQEFNEITQNSCLIKKFADVSKIAELKVQAEGSEEPVFNDAVKTRLKQVIDHLNFNYKQDEFEAHVKGFKDDAVELKIYDDLRAEQIVFIPATFGNKTYTAILIAHFLLKKPFFASFSDPESLKLSKNLKKKIEPVTVSGLMEKVEAQEVYRAFLDGEQGQVSLDFAKVA